MSQSTPLRQPDTALVRTEQRISASIQARLSLHDFTVSHLGESLVEEGVFLRRDRPKKIRIQLATIQIVQKV